MSNILLMQYCLLRPLYCHKFTIMIISSLASIYEGLFYFNEFNPKAIHICAVASVTSECKFSFFIFNESGASDTEDLSHNKIIIHSLPSGFDWWSFWLGLIDIIRWNWIVTGTNHNNYIFKLACPFPIAKHKWLETYFRMSSRSSRRLRPRVCSRAPDVWAEGQIPVVNKQQKKVESQRKRGSIQPSFTQHLLSNLLLKVQAFVWERAQIQTQTYKRYSVIKSTCQMMTNVGKNLIRPQKNKLIHSFINSLINVL